jgi:hypothetical protein
MKTSNRKFTRIVVPASLMLLGALASVTASAADAAKATSENGASCREETRRVAVWQQGGNPKFNQVPRFEMRAVKVCDGKVVSQPEQRSASNR